MPQLYQDIQLNITSNTTRANAAFADLLSQAITTVGGDIEVDFSTAFTMATTAVVDTLCFVKFQVLLDGSVQAGGGGGFQDVIAAATNQTERAGVSIKVRLTSVSAAAHTVKIQWATDSGTTTAGINPTLATSPDHGTLWLREIVK